MKPPGTAALPVWPTVSAVLVELNVPTDAEQLLVEQTSNVTLPVSSVSGSLNVALSVGVAVSVKTASAGATSAGVVGAASGVRFVTACAVYVAAWFAARSRSAVPEYATVTASRYCAGVFSVSSTTVLPVVKLTALTVSVEPLTLTVKSLGAAGELGSSGSLYVTSSVALSTVREVAAGTTVSIAMFLLKPSEPAAPGVASVSVASLVAASLIVPPLSVSEVVAA